MSTILIVDDDELVLELVSAALQEAGYSTLEARSGDEALRLCELHLESIDLLLTDVMMPGVGGLALAERVAAVRPELQVLFMSAVGELDRLAPERAFIQKPFRPTELLRRIRQLLGTA